MDQAERLKHWDFMPMGRGVRATSPTLARFLHEVDELGPRVAIGLDEESCWGASMMILFTWMDEVA